MARFVRPESASPIHYHAVDVAHVLALLFGLGTRPFHHGIRLSSQSVSDSANFWWAGLGSILMATDPVETRSKEVKSKVFISYSRKDMAFAEKLEAALNARDFEVLIDRQEIYAFEDWWKRIEALIGSADTVVFALSPDAVKSEVALKEITYAASLSKRFAPIVCQRVEESAVPEVLRRLNFIFFDDPAQFAASTDKLAKALQTDIRWIRRHTEFGEAARRWIEGDRAGGLLLRPPVLDQAEAWMTFRPSGAPSPTEETMAFIAASRKAEVVTRRRSRILNVALYALLVSIILGLVGWINQSTIAAQWHWYSTVRPFLAANVRPSRHRPGNSSTFRDILRPTIAAFPHPMRIRCIQLVGSTSPNRRYSATQTWAAGSIFSK
jgi:TIR domain